MVDVMKLLWRGARKTSPQINLVFVLRSREKTSFFTGSLSFTVINGTRYLVAETQRGYFATNFHTHTHTIFETFYHFARSTRGGRSHREFKYSAVLAEETGSKKVSVSRRSLRATIRTKRKEESRQRRTGRIHGSCRLNGTELKSFAWWQARHVVVVVVLVLIVVVASWAWQSTRRRHACLSFPVRSV